MLSSREISTEAALRDLGHSAPRVREQAASALSGVADHDRERTVVALRKALRDDHGAVRYAAALSLGELGDEGCLEALIDQLEDGDPMARQAAVIALGFLGGETAYERLRGALAEGPPEVRFQAVASLASIDAPRSFGAFITALSDDDAEVRAAAAAALGDLGDPRATGRLAPLLEDHVAACRFEAAFALARLGDRTATSTLVSFLPHRDLVLQSLEGLTLLRDPESLAPLRHLAGKLFQPPLVKVRVAGALAAQGDDEGRRLLQAQLTKRREDVRGLAVQVLGVINDEWARELLAEVREGAPDEELREMAAEALDQASGDPP